MLHELCDAGIHRIRTQTSILTLAHRSACSIHISCGNTSVLGSGKATSTPQRPWEWGGIWRSVSRTSSRRWTKSHAHPPQPLPLSRSLPSSLSGPGCRVAHGAQKQHRTFQRTVQRLAAAGRPRVSRVLSAGPFRGLNLKLKPSCSHPDPKPHLKPSCSRLDPNPKWKPSCSHPDFVGGLKPDQKEGVFRDQRQRFPPRLSGCCTAT